VLDHAAILAGLALAHSPQRQSLVSDVAHDRAPRGDWESVMLHVRNVFDVISRQKRADLRSRKRPIICPMSAARRRTPDKRSIDMMLHVTINAKCPGLQGPMSRYLNE
jgi:hypothetical protein